MKKNLFKVLMCASVIASMCFTVGVGAAGLTNPTSSAGDPWGPSLQQYSDRSPAYVTNWSTELHTVKAARSNREGYGDCIRLQRTSNDGDNWVKISSPAGATLTVGTEYTISVDYLPGPFGYNWASFGMQIYVGGQYLNFSGVKTPVTTTDTWETFSQDFTASKTNVPQIKLLSKSSDIYLDSLVIREKATGNVVFYNNFDLLKATRIHDWGYDPGIYAETMAVPFLGVPADSSVGVVVHDDGYAAYLVNEKSYDVSWRFSDVEAIIRALPVGTSCRVTFDYIYCDAGSDSSNYLADRMTWDESWHNVSAGKWNTYQNTFSSKTSTQCGFKIKPGCRICVDNFRIYDSEDNLLAEKDFDTVPLLGVGVDQFVAEPLTISQDGSNMTVSTKIINSYANVKNALLLTAIYNEGIIEDIDYISTDIASDPRGINYATSIESTIDVSGNTGKTFKAFLWEGLDKAPLVGSEMKTIE